MMKRRIRRYEAHSWFKPPGWAPPLPGYIWFLLQLHITVASIWKKHGPKQKH
jgi:hypothetical protein